MVRDKTTGTPLSILCQGLLLRVCEKEKVRHFNQSGLVMLHARRVFFWKMLFLQNLAAEYRSIKAINMCHFFIYLTSMIRLDVQKLIIKYYLLITQHSETHLICFIRTVIDAGLTK